MRPVVSLTIPQPCNESWAAMTPTATGRHCAACEKTVVDFTLKTDAEILAYLAGAARNRICGRFAAEQLERPLQRAELAAPRRWRVWLAAAAAVWSLRETMGVKAQAQVVVEAQRQAGSPATGNNEPSRPDQAALPSALLIRGRVLDAVTHEEMPGVSVLLEGTTTGTSTGADGSFELHLPATGAAGVAQVRFVAIGYVTQTRVLPIDGGAQTINIDMVGMELNDVQLQGMICYAPRKPWPWHPRAFYNWSKRLLTQPFRRSE
ncbi:carboxypeptidase-like regulatory domain-containing protein [Hymenobacter sp. BT664]|uniref:Carboxypeptidase-like regulatory domain-containing protein n=1 Tax=Hymenobacter montanus TaxID=2771359 RepID=A0A927BF29_9BACT|nr:carboxypeptidase-like regulatory domain-containing protein [Hymenobacter montanus]MBD2769080.1 carboxypeptidase-like regulatory domain-containing protein [Hymenobacter montanus]